MSLTKDLVQRALTSVDAPDGTDVVTGGALQWTSACDQYASVKLYVAGVEDQRALKKLGEACDRAVRTEAARQGEPVESFTVQFVDQSGNTILQTGGGSQQSKKQASAPSESKSEATSATSSADRGKPTPQEQADPLPGVQHAIAVGAGKGGVGKSTIAVSLAIGLARRGHAAGLLDGDIYGPSLPTMLGLDAMEQVVHEGKLQPFNAHGIKSVTVGKLVDPEKPLIWRGPMAHGAFQQLTSRTNWGELDELVIDLPPGTGDIPLTMSQSLQLTGAVIVCTPQRVAQDDAVRATRMFQQLGVEILGVVENMSFFVGDDGKEYDLFGRGGAEIMAQRMGLPFLGGVPINMALRANCDSGEPLKNFDPETAGGPQLPEALERLAENLESQIRLAAMKSGRSKPTLSIS